MTAGSNGTRPSTLPSTMMPPQMIDVEAQSAPTTPAHNVRSPGRPSTQSQDIPNLSRRSQTAKSYRPRMISGRQWKPGAEPGIDPSGGHPGSLPVGLKQDCSITVVDFSQEDIEVNYQDNSTLADFLQLPRKKDLSCRWINVNGLSWDVISLLGRENNFHRLSIEDMLNRRNRTKADWYSDHTYSELRFTAYPVPTDHVKSSCLYRN